MRDWKDFDGDGEVDRVEEMMAEEMLCTSRKEHEALFGDAGDFDDFEDDEFDDDLSELDDMEFDSMDYDEISDALEDAGFDLDDYDFD